MVKISLQYKIGFLLLIAVSIVILIGYVSYQSLSSIVSSIHVDAQPDYTLIRLKEISIELEKAENSIRLYTLSKDEKYLNPYYKAIFRIDEKINLLKNNNPNDSALLNGIDSISWLIGEKYLLWGHLVELHETDSTKGQLQSLSDELMKIDTISKNHEQQSLFKRLFKSRESELLVDHKQLADKVTAVESQSEQLNERLREEELKLAVTNNRLTSRIYALMQELEKMKRNELAQKAENADQLAKKTYRWLLFFLVTVLLLSLVVVFIVARFIRKTIASQKALEHSKLEAERLAKIKEIFTANVSHEIRTPLNAIYGFLEQVDMHSLEDDNRNKLNVVKTSSKNLLRIVNDVLDFSKLQSGKLTLEKSHYSIRSLVDEIFILFNESALNNQSVLSVNIDPDVSEAYYSDPFRLKQVVTNLVGNAIKFTRNGKILIDVSEENKTPEDALLVIRVSDTGIGIAAEKLELIFDDFTQGDAGTTQKYGGTGLGLSIVKKILELYGGNIQVESHVHKGSIFTCRIPQAIGNLAEVPTENTLIFFEPPAELNQYRVLIADDEEYNRLLLKTILNKWNMPFEEAVNGIDAIEKLKGDRFRLALLDIRMPGIDGLKAAKFIRETIKKDSSELPLVAITAAYSADECKMYKEHGFDEIVQKPFNEGELLRIICSLVGLSSKIKQTKTPLTRSKSKPKGKLDLSELNHISNGDQAFVKEMLETFLKSYQDGLKSIDEKVITNEYNFIAEIAHKICSPCRHLGADELWRLTKQLENECKKEGQNNNISKLVEDLKTEFLEVEDQIKSTLQH
jgi:signal transduction histidine kinase/HPt (histidine-containing phosphotransfer) domain-containing protein/FixJ family two-component response regulator